MGKLLNRSGSIHILPLLLIIAAIGIISFLLISSTAPLGGLFGITNPKSASHAQMMTDSCFFLKSDGTVDTLKTPAFCDTFDTIHNGGRAGDLDPTRWSVHRFNNELNLNAGTLFPFWPVAQAQFCTQLQRVIVPHDSFICGAQFNEPNHWMTAMDDHGTYQFMGGRVLQPFDFTNRTGTIVFDVDAKHAGSHTWWPEVWIAADPYAMSHHPNTAANGATPKDGIGFQFGATGCLPNYYPPNGVGLTPTDMHMALVGGLDEMDISRNYVYQDKVGGSGKCGFLVQADHANHIEIRISTTHVEIWVTDKTDMHGQPGPNFKQLFATDINPPLPFSRGYVYFQQSQYNSAKEGLPCGGCIDSQQTYHWHGLGFDGPILPTERDYPQPEDQGIYNNPQWVPEWTGAMNTGYAFPQNVQHTFTFNNVDLNNAKKAWFSFAFRGDGAGYPAAFQYTVNGKPAQNVTESNPMIQSPGYDGSAILVPIELTDLVQGTNNIGLKITSGNAGVTNVDLLVDPVDNVPLPSISMMPTLAPSATPIPSIAPSAGSSTTPAPSGCPKASIGDINCNGTVDLLDYSVLIGNFGKAVSPGTSGDLNKNGIVDLLDYSTLVANFGK